LAAKINKLDDKRIILAVLNIYLGGKFLILLAAYLFILAAQIWRQQFTGKTIFFGGGMYYFSFRNIRNEFRTFRNESKTKRNVT